MGGMWGACDDGAATEALNTGLDEGINFFDTAQVYGNGRSETLVGNVIRKRKSRDKVFLATKIPPKNYQWPAVPGSNVQNIFPASWIRKMTEASLKNLQTDCIDLQQLHVWSPDWLNQGDWLEALQSLRREGKIRYIGISVNDHEPETALDIVTSGLIDSIQVIYNIFDQSSAENLFPACEKHKVAVIARVPFDEGSLTGFLHPALEFPKRDWRKHYFSGNRLKETYERVEKLKLLLDLDTPTLPALALKFCLGHPVVTTVIPGMRRKMHVQASAQVSGAKALSPRVLEKLKSHQWKRNFYPLQTSAACPRVLDSGRSIQEKN